MRECVLVYVSAGLLGEQIVEIGGAGRPRAVWETTGAFMDATHGQADCLAWT